MEPEGQTPPDVEHIAVVSEPSSPQPSSGKKGPIIYVAVLLLLLIGGAAFYFGVRGRNASNEPSPTPSQATSTQTPTEEPTNTPSPTKKPTVTPTPRPTSTPTPTSVSFQVTGVVAAVSPTSSNTCPTTFNFTANITTNAAGSVTYKWERSDGASGTTETLVFTGAQTKTVETTWSIGNDEPPSKWEKVHILTPNDISSNQATFTLNCP